MANPLKTALVAYGFGVLGVFLVFIPWTPLWEHATMMLAPEPLRHWLLSGWLRGAVTGIGLIDLAAAVSEGAVLARLMRGGRL